MGFGLFPFSFAENIMIIDAHATDTVPSHEVRRRAQQALTNAGEPMSEVTYDALRKRITQLEAALHDVACHIWRGDWHRLRSETRAILDTMERKS